MSGNKVDGSTRRIPRKKKWPAWSQECQSCRWRMIWNIPQEVHFLLIFMYLMKPKVFFFFKCFYYLPEKVRLRIKFKVFPFKVQVELWSSCIRYVNDYCKEIRILAQLKSWSNHDECCGQSNHWLYGPIKTEKQEKVSML